MIELSHDQKKCLNSLLSWCRKNTEFITLGGYAGTGKTTLIAILRQELAKENKNLHVAFCSYTGRAAQVLRNKLLEENALLKRI